MNELNLNSYFHIGTDNLTLEAANNTLQVPRSLGKQLSQRLNPNRGWLRSMYGGEYNTDNLKYSTYDEMLLDPQIRSCITLIDYARLSKDIKITPASEDPQDIEVADFVREMISSLTTPFRLVRKNLYTSLRYGYAVSEINFTLKEIEGKQRVAWDTIQPLHISTIQDCFEYNDDNTIKTVWQTPYGNYSGTPIPIPGYKCLINTYDEIYGDKYGNSGLRSVYKNYFMKNNILKWYANYLYKLEGPAIIGKAGPNGNKGEIQKTIDDMKEGTLGGVIDAEDEINIIESQHRGEGFMTAINYHDHMIAINFMIGSLIFGNAESKGGSYAQSQTHLDVAMIFLDGLHEDDSIPLQQAIKYVVDLNFNVSKYPGVGFEPFTEKDLISLLSAIEPYAQNLLLESGPEWFQELIRTMMKQYADIEVTDDINEEDKTPKDAIPKEGPGLELPAEHQELVDTVTNVFPPTKNPV